MSGIKIESARVSDDARYELDIHTHDSSKADITVGPLVLLDWANGTQVVYDGVRGIERDLRTLNSDEKRALLLDLLDAVAGELRAAPAAESQPLRKQIEEVHTAASGSKVNWPNIKVSAKGLEDAAKAVVKIMPSVAKAVQYILSIVTAA